MEHCNCIFVSDVPKSEELEDIDDEDDDEDDDKQSAASSERAKTANVDKPPLVW